MRDFQDQLTRLKQVLKLGEDQDVADALGMTKAAFSARKQRGAFPVDKLKALATDRPDLRIDVRYVLTGVNDELERRLAAISTATKIAGSVRDAGNERYEVQEQVFQALVAQLDADEQQLVHCYRRADAKGKALLIATAVTLAGNEPVPRPGKRKRGKSK